MIVHLVRTTHATQDDQAEIFLQDLAVTASIVVGENILQLLAQQRATSVFRACQVPTDKTAD